MKSMSPTDQHKVPLIATQIAEKLKASFKENVVGVLLYGSSQWGQKYWDLDIIIILKVNDFKLKDLEILKQVQKEFNKHALDLQLVYQSEIVESETFSLDAHGAFFSQILKRALVLDGENPFVDMTPPRRIFLISIIARVQRYIFQARQEYIGGERYNKDQNPEYHKKHVLRMMFDVLLMSYEWIETDRVLSLFTEEFPTALSVSEINILSLESDSIENYMILYEKVYQIALGEISRLLNE